MRAGMRTAALFLAGIFLGSFEGAHGEAHVSVPFSYRSWEVTAPSDSTREVNQWVATTYGAFRLAENWDVAVTTTGTSTDLSSGEELSGAKNLRAQAFGTLGGGRFLLQGGVNLPTGKKELTPEGLVKIIKSILP